MKIDGSSQFLNSDLKLHQNDKAADQNRSSVEQVSGIQDRLESSASSRRLLQTYSEKVQEAPEIRTERVAEISKQIQAGTYNIKAEKVADAIINGNLLDKLV